MRDGPEVKVFDATPALLAAGAAAVGAAASEAIEARGAFTIALTGGSIARALYPLLGGDARGLVDWSRTHVWWIDERAVPPDHPESNYALARESLLRKVPVVLDHIHRMPADDPDPDRAAREYERTLPERFDLVLLGIGPDGHVCSLFPGHPALRERERRVVVVEGSPKPPPRRMTITAPVVERARARLMLASGAEKAEAVAAALAADGSVERTPARLARHGLWLLDAAAAAKLREP